MQGQDKVLYCHQLTSNLACLPVSQTIRIIDSSHCGLLGTYDLLRNSSQLLFWVFHSHQCPYPASSDWSRHWHPYCLPRFCPAFDKVDRRHLRSKLEHQGMNSLVLNLIHQLMYRVMTFSIIVNRYQSPPQSRNCGLLQGLPLSPILFNRFMDSLLQTFNLQSPASFPSAWFFADDGVLISPTFSKAQALLNQASNWANNHRMSFNIPKSGYLLMHTPSKSAFPPVLVLNHLAILFVHSYSYLGLMYSPTGIDFLAQGNLLSLGC